MCQLKKCFVSFALALLLSSASLVPCFASGDITGEDTTVNTDGTLCTVDLWSYNLGRVGDFSVPMNTLKVISTGYLTNGTALPITPVLTNLSSFILTEDVTLYWRVVPFLYGDDGISSINMATSTNLPSLPSFWYGGGNGGMNETETYQATVQRLGLGNDSYGDQLSRSYRATLPAETPTGAKVENFEINYPGSVNTANALWTTKNSNGDSLFFHIDLFQVVHTTDTAILDVLDEILANCETMNVNLNNILSALDSVVVQLQNLNADTDTIVDGLATLKVLSNNQLTQLKNISSSVDAIYYFLTQELKSESEELSGEAASVAGQIDNSAQAEAYYQTSMQGSYDALNLDGFTFGGIGGAMELVGTVFTDMWSAFGEYTILFTYPMILGIALLVIGRISKNGGGNSSRNAEHKGGEGGA